MKYLKGKSILRDEIARAENAIVKFDESIRLRDKFFTDETFNERNASTAVCVMKHETILSIIFNDYIRRISHEAMMVYIMTWGTAR